MSMHLVCYLPYVFPFVLLFACFCMTIRVACIFVWLVSLYRCVLCCIYMYVFDLTFHVNNGWSLHNLYLFSSWDGKCRLHYIFVIWYAYTLNMLYKFKWSLHVCVAYIFLLFYIVVWVYLAYHCSPV